MQTLAERNATPATTQPPKLMDRVRESLRVHRYALSTERTYCHWIKRFIFFHGKRHPAHLVRWAAGAGRRSELHALEEPSKDEALVLFAALGQFDVGGAL